MARKWSYHKKPGYMYQLNSLLSFQKNTDNQEELKWSHYKKQDPNSVFLYQEDVNNHAFCS